MEYTLHTRIARIFFQSGRYAPDILAESKKCDSDRRRQAPFPPFH